MNLQLLLRRRESATLVPSEAWSRCLERSSWDNILFQSVLSGLKCSLNYSLRWGRGDQVFSVQARIATDVRWTKVYFLRPFNQDFFPVVGATTFREIWIAWTYLPKTQNNFSIQIDAEDQEKDKFSLREDWVKAGLFQTCLLRIVGSTWH